MDVLVAVVIVLIMVVMLTAVKVVMIVVKWCDIDDDIGGIDCVNSIASKML